MSKKCRAYSESKLGTEPTNNRKAFYAGWEAALRAAPPQQAEPVEQCSFPACQTTGGCVSACTRAAPPQQAEPLTIYRLRDALVASRIIPPAAVEDPEEYDDGVTLHRIQGLHRRIT